MRVCPDYIGKLVSGYSRGLSVEWCDEDDRWYLCDGGRRLFTLDHADGSPVRNLDGHGTELLETLRRCDLRKGNPSAFRRRLTGMRSAAAYRARRDRERQLADVSGEARHVVRFKVQGPTPRSGGVFAGVSRG